MNLDPISIGYLIGTRFVPLLFALCFHEFSHGYVARLFGDRTAERMGRLTLNPFAHADTLGTFILPITSILTGFPLLGWAKPVPVDLRNMKNPQAGMFWVALAGPLSNFLLAIVAAFIMAVLGTHLTTLGVSKALLEIMQIFLLTNLMLAFFNLIPVQPLDGGQIIERFLPYNASRWMQENQGTISIALFMLIMLGGGRFIALPAYWMASVLLNLAAVIV